MITTWFYGVGVAQSFTCSVPCSPHDFHMKSYPRGRGQHVDDQITTWFPHDVIPGGVASMWMTKIPHDFHMLSYPGAWPACGWPKYHMISTCCDTLGHVASMWMILSTTWSDMSSWEFHVDRPIYDKVLHVVNWLSTCCVWPGTRSRECKNLKFRISKPTKYCPSNDMKWASCISYTHIIWFITLPYTYREWLGDCSKIGEAPLHK